MKFGAAKELITPTYPTRLAGYSTFKDKTFTSIHDDIFARVLTIGEGSSQLVLVSLDLLFHDFALTERLRVWASKRYGFDPAGLILNYSHTHTAPSMKGYAPGQHDDRYEAFLEERIKAGIDRAYSNREEGSLEYGSIGGDWNINRRLEVDGEMQLAPNPLGPTDPLIRVIVLRDASGSIRALASSYGCHPVSVRDSTLISGDFPGRMSSYLETDFYGATALFVQSCGGNSRPAMTAKGGRFVATTFDELDDTARSMARAVERLIERGRLRRIEPSIEAKSFSVRLDLEPYPRSVFEEVVASQGNRLEQAKVVLANYDDMPPHLDLPAGYIRLGRDLYLAWMGGEICYEVKQLLEPVFAPADLFFAGYADASAYIPSDSIIAEGGYEAEGSTIEYCLKGPIKTGVDARVVEAFRSHVHT